MSCEPVHEELLECILKRLIRVSKLVEFAVTFDCRFALA